MADENAGLRDLWGNPWTPEPDPRGRKRHKRQPEVAEKISVLRASGMTVAQIATRLLLSEPTLRKYYFRELDDAAANAEAVLIEAMWEKARAGNVSAARFIRETFGRGDAKRADVSVREREERAAPVGKKEQARLDAHGVGGKYAPPPAPTLIVNNG